MSEFEQHTTSPEDRVSWNQLIAYGMGGIVPIALFNIAGQLMPLLGNITLGLSALWLGTIMIIPRLWDAVSDPIIGHLSDNSRTRWGRRRPFILLGGISVAITFVAMWWVPQGEWIREHFLTDEAYSLFQLAFILIGLLAFYTACTIFAIPHGALGMEMSSDPHERTRLFSAASFLGNVFAMGTPWLLKLANLPDIRGPGGSLVDGMRFVSIGVAVVMIPLSFWWFFTLREPGFATAQYQRKSSLRSDLKTTLQNKTFLILIGIIFTLAMGFNFVNLFSYYIAIFYLYAGDENRATELLAWNGSAWAFTALLAVFPLNWISRRSGKSKTLLLAILLMCAAQLAKIVCYDPNLPYLVLIPTILLSAGMLMFFTLGSSMVGDVCDEDELHTGKRSEGTYYSVYWWFIKMGTAFASFVTGVLLTYTQFDEQQNKFAGEIYSGIGGVVSQLETQVAPEAKVVDAEVLDNNLKQIQTNLDKLQSYLSTVQQEAHAAQAEAAQLQQQAAELGAEAQAAAEAAEREAQHLSESPSHRAKLAADFERIQGSLQELGTQTSADKASERLLSEWRAVQEEASSLRQQAPATLFRLRAVEIGLPLLLSLVSISLTLIYPLTEERSYEVKAELKKRRAEIAAGQVGN